MPALDGRRSRRVLAALASPVTQTDAVQVLKATVAAVLAWWLADAVLALPQAFLAPWVALLTVHATVHRTVWRGGETVLAVGLGVVLSFLIVRYLGASTWSLALAVLVGLVLARLPWVRHEGVTVATTALFVITTGEEGSVERAVHLLPDRLLDTVIGVAVALVVNLLVLPPLDDRSAQRQVDDVDRRLGELLTDIADELARPWSQELGEQWVERTRSIDADIDHAWSLVRFSQESRWLNPRRRRHPGGVPEGFADVLRRLEEGVAQVRSIARHLRDSAEESQDWDPRFRDRFVPLLAEVGRRVADPEAEVGALRADLRDLVDELSGEDLAGLMWPLYGALLANLRIVVDVVDDVASASPVRT
ncbi:FUSC family protein [Phycicoccus endophyticus]|uniref:FUSC family protein n=1 Tax=Phycicoccus endophyticus TaxID=1690220 RepID=A0A7G9R282_9MICO|nr:aromatic acid exporter family protein [Phycicoccus endophyticus]NHI19635.1 hypothetical protein [Phycicoccus endophyticus]QNN49707.1 FUSC family protein [Phycicoccus endophyticus]GGL34348.1 FUSC family protein [Phycicoccus endophyticus]